MSSIVSSGLFFCEGKPGGCDALIYKHFCPADMQLVPAGGKRGLVDFVRGRLGGDEPVGKVWAVLRDRDYDFEPDPDAEVCVRRREKWRVFTVHRTCIENYLLDPRVLRRAWSAWVADGTPGLSEPPSLDEVRASLRGVARRLADAEAFFWAQERLRKRYMKSPWATVTLSALREAAGGLEAVDGRGRLVRLTAAVPTHRLPVDRAKVEAIFDGFAARFADAGFWARDAYLTWFHGKHLLAEARRVLKAWPLADKHLEKIAEHHIQRGDFADLDALSAVLASLPPCSKPPTGA